MAPLCMALISVIKNGPWLSSCGYLVPNSHQCSSIASSTLPNPQPGTSFRNSSTAVPSVAHYLITISAPLFILDIVTSTHNCTHHYSHSHHLFLVIASYEHFCPHSCTCFCSCFCTLDILYLKHYHLDIDTHVIKTVCQVRKTFANHEPLYPSPYCSFSGLSYRGRSYAILRHICHPVFRIRISGGRHHGAHGACHKS